MIKQSSRHPFPIYLTAGEYIKAVGTQDGYFPDFGHHVAGEMGEYGFIPSSCWTASGSG